MEVVVDQLYDGKTTLPAVLQELVQRAADVLDLDESQRKRTILRIDGHGGSQANVNWLLSQGYQLHTKEYSGKRAARTEVIIVDISKQNRAGVVFVIGV